MGHEITPSDGAQLLMRHIPRVFLCAFWSISVSDLRGLKSAGDQAFKMMRVMLVERSAVFVNFIALHTT